MLYNVKSMPRHDKNKILEKYIQPDPRFQKTSLAANNPVLEGNHLRHALLTVTIYTYCLIYVR